MEMGPADAEKSKHVSGSIDFLYTRKKIGKSARIKRRWHEGG